MCLSAPGLGAEARNGRCPWRCSEAARVAFGWQRFSCNCACRARLRNDATLCCASLLGSRCASAATLIVAVHSLSALPQLAAAASMPTAEAPFRDTSRRPSAVTQIKANRQSQDVRRQHECACRRVWKPPTPLQALRCGRGSRRPWCRPWTSPTSPTPSRRASGSTCSHEH